MLCVALIYLGYGFSILGDNGLVQGDQSIGPLFGN